VGRPSFQPTEEQRKLVKSLAVLGIQQEQICQAMGIRSEKTLRKHFRAELEEGSLHATVKVARTALEMATSGEYPAMTFFWEKCHRDLRAEREREKAEKERLDALGKPKGIELIYRAQRKDQNAE
jgi:hypothetical protein